MATNIETMGKMQDCCIRNVEEDYKGKQMIYKIGDKQKKNWKEMREEWNDREVSKKDRKIRI